jgi:putative membrane protein insertion efficiency factor
MKFLALAFIRFYQSTISPMLPSTCRFYPTCSTYAYEAVETWGAWRGAGMALRRVLRCRPFGGFGYDPVPEKRDSGARCQVPGKQISV